LHLLVLLALAPCEAVQLVRCATTKGQLVIEVHPEWAPLGAEHFLTLVDAGFYTDIALYRSVRAFLVQFGISDLKEHKVWHGKRIPDDPSIGIPITRGMVSFAGGGQNSRTTQLFIAYSDLPFLGKAPWETPFGVVVDGYDVLDSFTTTYGDIPPFGQGPNQAQIFKQGNAYLRELFPELDYIHWCERTESASEYEVDAVTLQRQNADAVTSVRRVTVYCVVVTATVIAAAVFAASWVIRAHGTLSWNVAFRKGL
jgi:cyclophilin family peptidyl-prolyl cis-trans isomerase